MAAVIVSAGSASAYSGSVSESAPTRTMSSVTQHTVVTADAVGVPRATIDGCLFEWFCVYPGTNGMEVRA